VIRDIIRESWTQSPVKTVAAVLLVPVAVLYGWAVLAIAIEALG
jgi:hypothetical protein